MKTGTISLAGILQLTLTIGLMATPAARADLFDELDSATTPGSPDKPSAEAEQEEFRKFVEQQNAEYAEYKEKLLAEFEEYKKIVQEETEKYQSSLSKDWDKPKLSSNTVWVDYSADNKARNSVDFEQETITIEVPEGSDSEASKQEVRVALTELVSKNKAEAFKDDVIAQAVEKRSIKEIDYLETAEVKPTPILITYLTGIYESSKREVEAIVDYMLENIESSVVENEAGRQVRKVKVPLQAPATVVQEAAKRQPVGRTLSTDITGKLPKKAVSLDPHVTDFAARDQIEKTLVYAIIETESAFNPMAKSSIPAYGLMQIVPESAGMDATKKLFGKERILSSSYLYDSEKNIEVGTTYLNILYYRYLAKVKNPQSRLYCVIAAYNTGAGNVAKAFTGNRRLSEALPLINQSTPEQVYEKLRADLPYEETQRYLVKVTARMKKYEALGL
jgi:membrane-bound lytic murein transglycosylase C